MAIECDKILAGAFEGAVAVSPMLNKERQEGTSWIPTNNHLERHSLVKEQQHSLHPTIVVNKFNGDPRKWQRFAHGIHATVRDANISNS